VQSAAQVNSVGSEDGDQPSQQFGGKKGFKLHLRIKTMCGLCEKLETLEDVIACKKASEKAGTYMEKKMDKFETKRKFKFTWKKVSKFCADIDSIEDEFSYDVRAYCNDCDPNNVDNTGVNMDEFYHQSKYHVGFTTSIYLFDQSTPGD